MAQARRRPRTTAALVRRRAPSPRQSVVVVEPPPAPSRYISRARNYLSARAGGAGGRGSLTSTRRLKRGAGLVAGGAAADLLGDTLTTVLSPGQTALFTAGVGYLLGDGTGSFVSDMGDGMLANAGGDWLYGKLRSWLRTGGAPATTAPPSTLPSSSSFIGPPAP